VVFPSISAEFHNGETCTAKDRGRRPQQIWSGCRLEDVSASDLDILVTDTGAGDEMIAPFERAQVEVVRV